jgi:hypothetical protein
MSTKSTHEKYRIHFVRASEYEASMRRSLNFVVPEHASYITRVLQYDNLMGTVCVTFMTMKTTVLRDTYNRLFILEG